MSGSDLLILVLVVEFRSDEEEDVVYRNADEHFVALLVQGFVVISIDLA